MASPFLYVSISRHLKSFYKLETVLYKLSYKFQSLGLATLFKKVKCQDGAFKWGYKAPKLKFLY